MKVCIAQLNQRERERERERELFKNKRIILFKKKIKEEKKGVNS